MNFLNRVVKTKKQEIKTLKNKVSLEALQKKSVSFLKKRVRRPFISLFHGKKSITVIAEIKPRSPSAGKLIKRSPLEVARMYARSKADAISVLTDAIYFGGDISLIKKVRGRVHQPILRKDFIIDAYQVYETLLADADAFLLIANILSRRKLKELIVLGESLGLEALVEVHTRGEIEKALAAGAELVGINNRNLKTLKINLKTTAKLIKFVPKNITVVSESGISSRKDVKKLLDVGVKGVLVGTSILQSSDPIKKIADLKR